MKHYSEIIKKVIADSNEKCDPNINKSKPLEKSSSDTSSINNPKISNQEITKTKLKMVINMIIRFVKSSYITIYNSIRNFNLKKIK